MSKTLGTIILIFVVVVGTFTFTYVTTTNQNNEVTEANLSAIVSKFVNTSAKEGEISKENYETFIEDVSSLGKSFSYSMEVQVLDDNPFEKGDNVNVNGENIHYSVYKSTIEKAIEEEEKFELNKGDNFIVSVEMEQTGFQVFLTKLTGRDIGVIKAEASALVTE